MMTELGGGLGIGLAGGIDRDGSRAGELLATDFASVEFGSVAAGIAGCPDDSAAVLAASLAEWRATHRQADAAPRIGVGLSRPAGSPPEALTDCWLAGLEAVAGVADYVSFNLTAAANRPLLAAEYRPLLARSFGAVRAWRDATAAAGGRHLHLAVKLSLGVPGAPLPSIARLAAVCFDQLTVVREGSGGDFSRLSALATYLVSGPPLVAIGGIRSADDVCAARAAGAAGVQVHRAFVEHGAACLPMLCREVPRAVREAPAGRQGGS